MKTKIRLDTLSDIHNFVRTVSQVKVPVYVSDEAGHCVSAKSILGMLYSMEWSVMWCKCDEDIYSLIEEYATV